MSEISYSGLLHGDIWRVLNLRRNKTAVSDLLYGLQTMGVTETISRDCRTTHYLDKRDLYRGLYRESCTRIHVIPCPRHRVAAPCSQLLPFKTLAPPPPLPPALHSAVG